MCMCFTVSGLPRARASNTYMGKGVVVSPVSENWCQGLASDRLLKSSTNVEGIHVHSKILSLSLVRTLCCIEVAWELEVLEHLKQMEEHGASCWICLGCDEVVGCCDCSKSFITG